MIHIRRRQRRQVAQRFERGTTVTKEKEQQVKGEANADHLHHRAFDDGACGRAEPGRERLDGAGQIDALLDCAGNWCQLRLGFQRVLPFAGLDLALDERRTVSRLHHQLLADENQRYNDDDADCHGRQNGRQRRPLEFGFEPLLQGREQYRQREGKG